MFFSMITPTPGMEQDAALQWAKGHYAQHQWLWQFLPAESGAPRDFLFRRRDGSEKLPGYYVVSKRRPQTMNEAWQVDVRDYNPQLLPGQRLAFDVRINPVISHKVGGKPRRDDVVMHEKKKLLGEHGLKRWSDWSDTAKKPLLYDLVQNVCTRWLAQRSECAGFKLENSGSLRVDGYLQHQKTNKDITFSTVDFSGELEVTNVESFKHTLFNGLGPAKAFGCGLMLVRRA